MSHRVEPACMTDFWSLVTFSSQLRVSPFDEIILGTAHDA